MDGLNILDCTLRDGGYVNEFNFGKNVMIDIIKKLSKGSIDIIECGFLQSGEFDQDKSLFGNVELIKNVIGEKNPKLMYVVMIQYGKISIDEISDNDGTSIDGIRLTFHEHEIDEAFVLGKQLMEKGYKIFMQPVGTTTYTDAALLQLINRINTLCPFAFYLVDTLGIMYKNDLLRMFYLVDHNLDKRIAIGFHSHNNLQLSFANAQELMQLNTPRRLIIDASIFGMGRGAGNLNTELVTQYINSNFGLKYDNIEILEIIDEYIRPLSLKYKWGYDAAYYLASVNNCHPNYASFLLNKQTMHVQDINAILQSLDMQRRALFDKDYISERYIEFMNHHIDDSEARNEIETLIGRRKVLLLAPGKSLRKNAEAIINYIENNDCFVISVNFIPTDISINMMFVSNMKRFDNLQELTNNALDQIKIVLTSNITTDKNPNFIIINYAGYLNEDSIIADNAGLICINLMKKIGFKEITLAGFDGFSVNKKENYYMSSLYLDVEDDRLVQMNEAITKKIQQLRTQINIKFLTTSEYQEEQ
jgi:4-hydroxy 2-oxovalerate aldolase